MTTNRSGPLQIPHAETKGMLESAARMYVCVHMYIHNYTHAYIYIYNYVFMYIYIYMHIFFQEFMGLFGQHAVVDEARWGDLTKTKQDMSPQGLANCFWAISKLAGTPEGMLGRLIQREIHFLGKLLGIIIIYVYIYISYTNTLGSLRRSKIIVTIRTKHHKNG